MPLNEAALAGFGAVIATVRSWSAVCASREFAAVRDGRSSALRRPCCPVGVMPRCGHRGCGRRAQHPPTVLPGPGDARLGSRRGLPPSARRVVEGGPHRRGPAAAGAAPADGGDVRCRRSRAGPVRRPADRPGRLRAGWSRSGGRRDRAADQAPRRSIPRSPAPRLRRKPSPDGPPAPSPSGPGIAPGSSAPDGLSELFLCLAAPEGRAADPAPFVKVAALRDEWRASATGRCEAKVGAWRAPQRLSAVTS